MRVRRVRSTVHFDFAPMVDVVLVLLLFFLTAAILGRPNTGLPVRLPTASQAQQDVAGSAGAPVVTLSANGSIALAGRQNLSPSSLTSVLKPKIGPSGMVVLEADASARHGRVVQVMDAIQAAGAGRLSVGVLPRTP